MSRSSSRRVRRHKRPPCVSGKKGRWAVLFTNQKDGCSSGRHSYDLSDRRMSASPLPAPADTFVFGDSSCRPPGDGQENASTAEHVYTRQYQKYHPVGGLKHTNGPLVNVEANCSCKHEVCCKMKKGDLAERQFESEPSKHVLSTSYLQWARDLHELLDDCQGLDLFQRFLANEKCNSHSLDFWLAIRGLKSIFDNVQLMKAIKVIYKKYVKASMIRLRTSTKHDISSKINSKMKVDDSIFDAACRELEETELHNLYTNFLKSDLYLKYVQLMQNGPLPGDSCRQSESSGSNSSTGSRDMLDIMPTVPEECELRMDYKNYSCTPVLSLPKENFRHRLTSSSPETLRFNNNMQYLPSAKTRYSNSPYAKYSSYLPPSAQDSDRQSLSSDAHTDDAMSMSDLDIGRSSKSHRSYERSMRKNAHINNHTNELQPMIPRTYRMQVGTYTEATKDPESFAGKLIDKLYQLKQDWEKREESHEKLINTLKKLDMDDDSYANNSLKRFEHIPPQLLTATIQEKFCATDESDQSILDQHVSRIWNDSLHQTPNNLTPGQYSPTLRSRSPPILERPQSQPAVASVPSTHNYLPPCGPTARQHRGSDVNTTNITQYSSRSGAYTHHRHRRDRDTCSTDSGTVNDYIPDNDYPVVTDHGRYQTPSLEAMHEQQQLSMNSSSRRSKEGASGSSRRASLKKYTSGDSDSSCLDSGVSVCDKVSRWLADDKFSCAHGSNSEKDSSHHKKSSHSSQSNSSGTQSKQSKKLPPGYNVPSRSLSLDHSVVSGSWPGVPQKQLQQHNTNLALQQQQQQPLPVPLAQQSQQALGGYPQMDVTAQLVEAKKRLEEETRFKLSSSGRSKSGSSSKAESSRGRSMSSKVPDISEEKTSLRKINKRSSNVGLTPTAGGNGSFVPSSNAVAASPASSLTGGPTVGEVTIVCYCFSGEQIPYLTKLPGKNITFKQFKTIITKRGNFRFFFKTVNTEFGPSGVVQEEVMDDNAIVPLWEGKISCTIEPIPDP